MQFLYPNVFFMMFIPLLVLIVLVLTSKENMQQYFSKEILDKLSVGGRSLDKTTRNGLFFITLILFIFALGRPVMNEKEQSLQQNLIPIVIALDVSKSMLAEDIYPNRISLAKEKLKDIIELAENSTIGILLFAKDSFILSPVTEDFISLKYIVENLDTNLDFTNGSNIYATLETTSYMLEEFKVKNLIILSDGGNDNGYTKELEFAKENNIEIYSIGIATKKGAPIPQKNGYLTNKEGNIVSVKLNESIKNLSLKSGGGYIDFTINKNDVGAIISRINKQSKKEELTTQKIKTYTELFYYPLGLALFVLLIALSSFPKINFKRTQSISGIIIMMVFFMIPIDGKSEIFEFKNIEKANQLYNDKQYKDSSNEYRKISASPQTLYNLANSLYKDKKYKEAIETYSKVVTTNEELESKKLHNIGNGYVNINNLEKAKEFYEKALKIKDDKQTKENLEMVKKELEKK
ncbi:MAG: VWA domain-containing protein, partial [Campylobacterota bacterium]|nr:VWA domain-containing protein [Campylobacterota bacterium]